MKIPRSPRTWKVTRSTRPPLLHSNPTNQPCHFPPPTTFYIQTLTLTNHFRTLPQSNKTMATLTFTILFFFFTFSSARISIPLTLAENYVIAVSNSNPETNSKQTILLPSQKLKSSNPTTIFPSVSLNPDTILPSLKLESSDPTTILPGQKPDSSDPITILPGQKAESSDPATILSSQKLESSNPATVLELELEPEITNPQTRTTNEPGGSDKDLPVLSDTISIESLHLNPLSYIRIRPINRHFHIKPSLFRIHRCRRHHHHHHHHMNHGNMGHEVPYGDDIAGQTIDRFEPSMLRGSVRSTPAKLGRIHHYQHYEDDSMMKRHPFRQYMFAKQKLKRKVEEENEKRKDEEESTEGGFMKKVRKFLNHI